MIAVQHLPQSRIDSATIATLHFSSFPTVVGPHDPHAVRYALARLPAELLLAFRFEIAVMGQSVGRRGEFTERLWEWDVGELFLLDGGSGRYEEFNLSPDGAWWRCAFSAYRLVDATVDCKVAAPAIWTGSDAGDRYVALSFPLSQLSVSAGLQSRERLAVCAILGQGNGRTYYSTSDIDALKPDFHDSARFQAVR